MFSNIKISSDNTLNNKIIQIHNNIRKNIYFSNEENIINIVTTNLILFI